MLPVADVVEAGQLQAAYWCIQHTYSSFHAGVRRLTYMYGMDEGGASVGKAKGGTVRCRIAHAMVFFFEW